MRDQDNVYVLFRLPFGFSYKLWQKFKDKLNNTLPIALNVFTAHEEYTRHSKVNLPLSTQKQLFKKRTKGS